MGTFTDPASLKFLPTKKHRLIIKLKTKAEHMKKLSALLLLFIVASILLTSFIILRPEKTETASKTQVKDYSLIRIRNEGVIKVGTSLDELPWGGIDKPTGKYIGGEVEIANLIGRLLGAKVEFVNRRFDFLTTDLLNHKFDIIIAGMSITPERRKIIEFSNPYFFTGQAVAVSKTNKEIKNAGSLNGKIIGTLAATTSYDYARSIPGIKEVRGYESPEKYFTDTIMGTIDAAIYDLPAVYWYVKNNPELNFSFFIPTNEGYGVGIRREDEQLRERVNLIIEKIRNSDEFKEIISRWYGPN